MAEGVTSEDNDVVGLDDNEDYSIVGAFLLVMRFLLIMCVPVLIQLEGLFSRMNQPDIEVWRKMHMQQVCMYYVWFC